MTIDADGIARLRYAWRNNGAALIIIDELEKARAELDARGDAIDACEDLCLKFRLERDSARALLLEADIVMSLLSPDAALRTRIAAELGEALTRVAMRAVVKQMRERALSDSEITHWRLRDFLDAYAKEAGIDE